MSVEHLKFPIGKFAKPAQFTKNVLESCISTIENFPLKLKKVVEDYTELQLDTPYRPEGWTVRQVIHHCADSHINSFARFKFALTEEKPTIKPYFEDRWAELPDAKTMPIEPSLDLLHGLHARWAILLKSLNDSELKRCFIHPEHGREIDLTEYICFYAWHCEHHLAHVLLVK
ncbi:MAG: YfiT family bacillithiol transferase [Cytophagales bacterium]